MTGMILFVMILSVPGSTIFQSCRDGSSWVEPVLSSLAQRHSTDSTSGKARTRNHMIPSLMLYQLSHCAPLADYRYLQVWYDTCHANLRIIQVSPCQTISKRMVSLIFFSFTEQVKNSIQHFQDTYIYFNV